MRARLIMLILCGTVFSGCGLVTGYLGNYVEKKVDSYLERKSAAQIEKVNKSLTAVFREATEEEIAQYDRNKDGSVTISDFDDSDGILGPLEVFQVGNAAMSQLAAQVASGRRTLEEASGIQKDLAYGLGGAGLIGLLLLAFRRYFRERRR
jgi:hypothetical protein